MRVVAWEADWPFVGVFFYGYGDDRVLHSFPTRRSSDLVVAVSRVDDGEEAEREVHAWNAGRDDGDARNVLARCEDRKSTRLNSSHTVISYAVFCLKKKIAQPCNAWDRGRARTAPGRRPS